MNINEKIVTKIVKNDYTKIISHFF